ncbi:MAG TPA: tryptophan synthase subunit alpha [Acidimicrobiia bacterium]|jgi:tryptophan synthase alpha chain|nr:tryptophan synthase subunit alpha [Acidimicrobiia bacterium]
MSDRIGEVTAAIERASGQALCAYVTAGYPTKSVFPEILAAVAASADVVEIGIPFTDPMADGLTIQQASHVALAQGVDLRWALETVGEAGLETPVLFMGYYNPFLAFGLERLVAGMTETGVAGLIVPDLPVEESGPLAEILDPDGHGLVQLVAPTTPEDRLRRLAAASRGFVYAVATTGITGGSTHFGQAVLDYLDRVKAAATLPVLAGFGVRERAQVAGLAGHVDGVVVGSALIDAIDRGDDPASFLADLRPVSAEA